MHAIMYTTLIQVAELAALLEREPQADASVVVLDCRHELSQPEWSDRAYAAGHIPTAVQAHLDRDLSGPVTPTSGRHPLPDVTAFAETLGRWGIDNTVQVVAYDQGNGVYAARAWWLLRWVGHSAVAVLDGGFAAWQEAGLRVSHDAPARAPRRFVPHVAAGAALSTAEVEQALMRNEIALVDARGADRFRGENETIDPVAGHVPGATNRPFGKNVDGRGRFLPAAELRRQWTEALAGRDAREVVAMCGSGVSACHNLLALEIAGLSGARLYAGSWSEWIRDPRRPIARGPA
ncbi:MAG TPA: sulfurtransferase [Steroidobacteraceae bacterium]|jgi:thiosulfate/3-mercaptopyruvate sulfurtransferase|nr:sulfurtransferase [Steroidobacteraceae bacterium]